MLWRYPMPDLTHDRIWQDREQEYINTIKKYTAEEQRRFTEMFSLLAETLGHGTEETDRGFYFLMAIIYHTVSHE